MDLCLTLKRIQPNNKKQRVALLLNTSVTASGVAGLLKDIQYPCDIFVVRDEISSVGYTSCWELAYSYAQITEKREDFQYYAFGLMKPGVMLSEESQKRFPLLALVEVLKHGETNGIVAVHPSFTDNTKTPWIHLKHQKENDGELLGREVNMIDHCFALYLAEWFRDEAEFPPQLVGGLGTELEWSYRARSRGKHLHVLDQIQITLPYNEKGKKEMIQYFQKKYGNNFMTILNQHAIESSKGLIMSTAEDLNLSVLEEAIKGVIKHDYPYPYSIGDGQLLTPELNRTLRKALPTTEEYSFSNRSYPERGFLFLGCNVGYMQNHTTDFRQLIGCYDNKIYQFKDSPIWDKFLDWLMSDTTLDLWIQKYKPELISRFGLERFKTMKFYQRTTLCRDLHGYEIKPHTDTPRKALTFLMYLPADSGTGKQGSYGTRVYVDRNDRNETDWDIKHQENSEGFETFCNTPFKVGSFIDFCIGPKSWHGVGLYDIRDLPRDSIQVAIYPIFDREILHKNPLPNGKVSRIGIINSLVSKYHLTNYLEIGTKDGKTFNQVVAPVKDGVDPVYSSTNHTKYLCNSDEFFKRLSLQGQTKYDLIFIDGLHEREQVIRDIQNSLKVLTRRGFIVVHDCNPIEEVAQEVPRPTGQIDWNGNVWQAYMHFRTTATNLEMVVVDADHGVGVIRRGKSQPYSHPDNKKAAEMTYVELESNRKEMLNLISVEEFDQRFLPSHG